MLRVVLEIHFFGFLARRTRLVEVAPTSRCKHRLFTLLLQIITAVLCHHKLIMSCSSFVRTICACKVLGVSYSNLMWWLADWC